MRLRIFAVPSADISSKVKSLGAGLTQQFHPDHKPVLYHIAKGEGKSFRMVQSPREAIFSVEPHITLLALEVEKEGVPQVVEAVSKALEKQKPLRLTTEGYGYYKELGLPPFTIYAKVSPVSDLSQIRHRLAQALGVSPENDYVSHITLFYDDACSVADAVLSLYNELGPERFSFTVEAIAIFAESPPEGFGLVKKIDLKA